MSEEKRSRRGQAEEALTEEVVRLRREVRLLKERLALTENRELDRTPLSGERLGLRQILDVVARPEATPEDAPPDPVREELAQAHHRLRSIIDSTGDSICAIDEDHRLLLFNDAYAGGFERRFGYAPVVGLDLLQVFEVYPHELAQVKRWWGRALGGEAYSLLREGQASEGESRYFDVRFAPLRDERGRQFGAVSVTRDVTELKHAEQELSRTNQRLEEANQVLERRNRELQSFAYVASHDLQEPLRKIRAFADLAIDDYGDDLQEQGRFYLERVQHGASHMAQLINDLLAFSRVETQARPFTEVPLDQLAREVLDEERERIEETGAEVDVGALPVVEAEPVQMHQLLRGLLSNALKFRREDVAPRVRIEAERFQDDARGAAVRLVVCDNGIGFDEQYLEKIFAPFQQLHTRGTYRGTGIGLALCRRIVERHGGTITARSEPGEGSRFTVELPVRQE